MPRQWYVFWALSKTLEVENSNFTENGQVLVKLVRKKSPADFPDFCHLVKQSLNLKNCFEKLI